MKRLNKIFPINIELIVLFAIAGLLIIHASLALYQQTGSILLSLLLGVGMVTALGMGIILSRRIRRR